ncbi:4Fe-4S binding protein [Desulfospira joergensenii]|uniref:4Fe-4S binding protein n=1 Tax=Desulfospira joergensenii TaxID=53329 RepID=UPI0003B6248E|nr:4Fe-4S binding protein [Desulfospira joergensenii]
MKFHRLIQFICLGLFVLSLGLVPHLPLFPPDTFLRMDPLILMGAGIAGRVVFSFFWIILLLLFTTLLLGRYFCGHVCPLGTSIDVVDKLLAPFRKKRASPFLKAKRIRYLVLVFIMASALLGVSFVFWVSPLALATRLYGTVLLPVIRLLASGGINLLRNFDVEVLAYVVIAVPQFTQVWATSFVLLLIFSGGFFSPRFFCKFLCPSGAVFSLFSYRPLFRRQVEKKKCTECGQCLRHCPMEAIDPGYMEVDTGSCMVCRSCETICPDQAVSFTLSGRSEPIRFSRPRRDLIIAAAAGAGASLLALSNASGFYPPGHVLPGPEGVIRPPGALPEALFLARCVRCGVCMAACPTNTLQPVGLAAGFTGLFSPEISPVMGPCEPQCCQCGRVCPTQAIPLLSKSEKLHAKAGTARILSNRCIAWEQEKSCLICDEICPFDAIELKTLKHYSVAVPFINENKCWGCGFCEYKCPISPGKAIRVEPFGALRLSKGTYSKAAVQQGLDLSIARKKTGHAGGYLKEDESSESLPPGFTD